MKKKERAKKTRKPGIGTKIVMGLIFLAGIGILSYPAISNLHNQWLNARYQAQYDNNIKKRTPIEKDRLWKIARQYNKEHTVNTGADIFGKGQTTAGTQNYRYKQVLNPQHNGMMGYIEIPKANIMLSMFHGTSEKVLERGAGHLAGTGLPVGGKSNHCVLAAHRGLPGAKLFTDVDQLVAGDKFYLHTVNHILAYRIERIKTVEPKNLMDELHIVAGRDLTTLVTCTPYGVNSHRLVIRGQRVPMDNHKAVNPLWKYLKYAGLLIAGCAAIGIWYGWRKRKKSMKKGKSWKSKIAALVTVFLLLFGNTSSIAWAKNDNYNLPPLETGKKGTLTVAYSYNGSKGSVPLSGGLFSCIKVADLQVKQGIAKYQPDGDFAAAGIDFEDMTATASHEAAAMLYSMAREQHISGSNQRTDGRGVASFANLTPGMYVVAQSKKLRIGKAVYFAEPFLVSVPSLQGTGKNRHWQYMVTAKPKTTNREQDKTPGPNPKPRPHPGPHPPSHSHAGKTITGDPFHYALWGWLLAGAGITMIGLLYYRRKAS